MPPRKNSIVRPPRTPRTPVTPVEKCVCEPPQVTEANIRQAGVAISLVFVALCVGLLISRGITIDWTTPVDPVNPDPITKPDLVSETFDRYEQAFREVQGLKAELLRSGSLTSEEASVKWFSSQEVPQKSFEKLLDYEYEQFGGEQWTAEKEAEVAERWATGGTK